MTSPHDTAKFGAGEDWNAAAHVRLLRDGGGSASGYTSDLIQNLHCTITALSSEIARLQSRVEKLEATLGFYANRRNWISGRWLRAHEEDDDADDPVEHLICVEWQCEDGGVYIPCADCGDHARRALSQTSPEGEGDD